MERNPMEMALSTDIVMDIVLSYLKVRDLLSCRLPSKFWNKVASSALRRRSTMMKNISDEKKLMELEECLMRSLDFPFVGLTFNQPWSLNSDRALKFFQTYGERFTRLRLDTCWTKKMYDLAPFIDHLTCLSILETGRDGRRPTRYPYWPLSSTEGQDDGKTLKLPSVRTVRIYPYPDILEDVLREVVLAASPSVQIECLDATREILRALANVGKLRAVSTIKFDVDEDGQEFDLKESDLLSLESPSLTKLAFNVRGCLTLDGLMKIMLSSQQSLQELRLNGLQLSDYAWEKFPVFTKLTTLRLCVEIKQERQYLFKGRHGHKFPALKELELEIPYDRGKTFWEKSHLSDGLFIVPSVTRIDLRGYVSEDRIKALAQTFPNVVEIGMNYRYYSDDGNQNVYYYDEWGNETHLNGGSNPFEIWTVREFEHLEKLRIWNFAVRKPSKNYVNMDSFLTGISVGVCQNLRKQEHLMLKLIKSPFGEAFSQVIRDNPNILQLKNLRELVVCVVPDFEYKQLPTDTSCMSRVSMWYALDMMPNLRAKFVHYGPSLHPSNERRDKARLKIYHACRRERSGCYHNDLLCFLHAGLEAPFQDVQEYIKLEPFFY